MSPILLLLIGMGVVVGGVLGLRLHAFLALIVAALSISFLTPRSALDDFAAQQLAMGEMSQKQAKAFATQNAASRVASEFGEGCRKVGLLIAMAAIIGKCLLDSGAAQRIVLSILAVFGAARAQLAFLFSGFLLAIPVFFDTVFYLLIPIGRAMRRKTGNNYLLYILTIVAGTTMAHSLVPPTPGPLLVAGALDVEIGTMMIGGVVVGFFTVSFGYLYASWANKHWEIPLRDSEGDAADPGDPADVAMPPASLAFLPILLPVLLIFLGTLNKSLKGDSPDWLQAIAFLGDKNFALTVSAGVALAILALMKRNERLEVIGAATKSAIASGATIIMITAAGAAFGGVLRHTGIAESIAGLGGTNAGWLALPIAFLITALVRTAQGSATVAMITAAPIAHAFMEAGELGFHPVYLALAIGCGSKPIPWMNDSGFWIITRMTGMTESETLRFVTPMMTMMGIVGLLVTMLAAWLLPLV